MRLLLWQTLFFRLLNEQKKLFLIAGLTVSLGVALALGIRLGTQSAVKSLENAILPKDSEWSDTLIASTPEAKLLLRDIGIKFQGLLFSAIDGYIEPNVPEKSQDQMSLLVFWGADQSQVNLFENRTNDNFTLITHAQCLKNLNSVSTLKVAGDLLKVQFTTAQHPLLANCRNFISSPNTPYSPRLQEMLDSIPLQLSLPIRDEIEKKRYAETIAVAALVPGIEAESNKKRVARLEDVTVSFRTNLQLMGFIALFIGFAMVHHIFSLIVAKQSKTIATLCALGINTRRQASIILCLSLVLATLSSTFGTFLGIFIGRFLGEISSFTVKNLYDSLVDPQNFQWDKLEILYGFGLGFAACLAGCIYPIVKLTRLPVAQIIRDGSFESHDISLTPKQNIGLILAIVALSLICLKWTVVWNRIPLTALIACLGFLIASALIARQIGHVLYTKSNLVQIRRSWATQLRIFLSPQAAVVVQILTLTFTLTFGVKGMAESFRKTLSDWSNETLKADFWVRTVGGAGSPLPENLLRKLDLLDPNEVIAIDRLSIGPASLSPENNVNEKPVLIAAARFREQSKVSPMKILLPTSSDSIRQAQLAKEIVTSSSDCSGTRDNPCSAYISEPIAVHFALESPIGNLLCPRFRSQIICFKVVAVYQDFGSDQGVILSDENVFDRLLIDPPKPSFTNIYLKNPSSPAAQNLEKELRNLVENSGGNLAFEKLSDLQTRILHTFDNTFRITDALYILCGIIAIIATMSTLNLQILLRSREWSIQWTLGVSNTTILSRFAWWSAGMAFLAALVSIFGGAVLASILVYAVNYYSFGYSLQLAIPWTLPLIVLFVATVSGYISGRLQTRALAENTTLKNLILE